jgi:small subunit ribosomal protein S2
LFLPSILFNGRGLMLFVNSDMALRYFVCYYAVHCGSSYVVSRWISGFLTNFYHFIRLSNKGMFLGLFGSFFVGVRFLRRLPSFIFVSDVLHNSYVLNEACRLHIPICGVIDSNFSGLCFSFPIPGNDDSFRSVVFLNAVVSRCILLCKLSRLRFFVRLV